MMRDNSLTPKPLRDWGHLTDDERKTADIVKARFLTGFDKDWFLESLKTEATTLKDSYQEIAKAYVNNLDALISVVGLPLTTASNHVYALRFQQILMAERIRHAADDENHALSAEAERKAAEIASRKIHDEFASNDGFRTLAFRAYNHLVQDLEREEFNAVADELLRQGCLLAWGAIEVLARDLFVQCINSNPSMVKRFVEDPSRKSTFSLKHIDIHDLIESEFNMSESMGNYLIRFFNFNKLELIRETFALLFPEDALLRAALNDLNLWILYQRRHLIVHKRGIVDRQYLDKTGETIEIGSSLHVSPQDISNYLLSGRNLGKCFFGAIRSLP